MRQTNYLERRQVAFGLKGALQAEGRTVRAIAWFALAYASG
jgi:hypothetical protein